MKIVYLLVGPRGAGKSKESREVRENKRYKIISRDRILDRFLGGVHQSSYTGAHYVASEIVKKLLEKALDRGKEHIVLDTWTGEDSERIELVQSARELGADRVVAVYFTTPLEKVCDWFWLKPGIAKSSTRPKGVIDPLTMNKESWKPLTYFPDDAPLQDYTLFHQLARGIDSNGFDQVIRFNPLKQRLHEVI